MLADGAAFHCVCATTPSPQPPPTPHLQWLDLYYGAQCTDFKSLVTPDFQLVIGGITTANASTIVELCTQHAATMPTQWVEFSSFHNKGAVTFSGPQIKTVVDPTTKAPCSVTVDQVQSLQLTVTGGK
jgi:hypothetical protein